MEMLKNHAEGKHPLLFVVFFWGMALFQFTMFKHIWGIEGLARVFNSVFLLGTIFFCAINILKWKLSIRVWFYYMFPGALVFLAFFINVTLNVSRDSTLLSYYGNLLPWAIFIIIPFLMKNEFINVSKLYFHYFLLIQIIVFFGLLEYILVSANIVGLDVLETPNGVFLSGYFSIYHMLSDGTAYYRFYASMGEPGSLAMALLPAIAYAFVYKKYLSFIVFIFTIYLTHSLGGYISLCIMFLLLALSSLSNAKKGLVMIICTLLLSLVAVIYSGEITRAFEKKGASSSDRADNVTNVIENLPEILAHNPVGYDFVQSMSSNTNKYYYGSNFTIGNIIFYGGGVALFGYLAILLLFLFVSLPLLFRNTLTNDEKILLSSIVALLPFVVQRETLLESALLIVVFSPHVINRLNLRSDSMKLDNDPIR